MDFENPVRAETRCCVCVRVLFVRHIRDRTAAQNVVLITTRAVVVFYLTYNKTPAHASSLYTHNICNIRNQIHIAIYHVTGIVVGIIDIIVYSL